MSATQRLQAVVGHVSTPIINPEITPKITEELTLVLPSGGKVTTLRSKTSEGKNTVVLDEKPLAIFSVSNSAKLALHVSSVNTPHHEVNDSHLPRYPLILLSAPLCTSEISIADLWITIYALFTLYHANENIPIVFDSGIANARLQLSTYLVSSGLSQRPIQNRATTPNVSSFSSEEIHFLSRSTFWQGAGTTGYHTHSWIQPHVGAPAIFPTIETFTRTDKVITSHPVRPPKPAPGTVLYRRWCNAVKQSIEITFFDIDGVADGSGSDGRTSAHMSAFHKWHNNERVNNAWGERGTLAAHRAYVEGVLADPHTWICMLSWDGELMGYTEIVYTKEDHVAAYFPAGVIPGDWERGLHVLAGENKFVGSGRAEIWLRSLVHYAFLADPRTSRVMGEPSLSNVAIQKTVVKAGFHVETVFDFPYKRSALVLNPRERFFRLCNLW